MSAREPVDLLAVYLRMQGFRVLTVELRDARRGPARQVKVLTLEDRRGFHRCGVCGRRHVEGAFQETEAVYFRDSSLGDLETYLEVFPWRVACCGGTHREGFPFEMPGHRTTRHWEADSRRSRACAGSASTRCPGPAGTTTSPS
jgi:hypothetical protein